MKKIFYMFLKNCTKLSALNHVIPKIVNKCNSKNPAYITSKRKVVSVKQISYKKRRKPINVYADFFKIRHIPMSKPRLLLLSSSKVHGFEFLEYAASDINNFLNKNNVSTVLFVPYAAVDHDAYLKKVSPVFGKWGFQVEGIHKHNPIEAVKRAEAIFVGGGNTFLLLKTLYDKQLVQLIRERVLNGGVPYIGSSAGTNIAAPTIHNTNDMPIVYPPSFCALNLIPFNINPHYLDADVASKHKGETREERILQYHELPDEHPVHNVLGLREGCTLYVDGDLAELKGMANARLFLRGKPPLEIPTQSNLSHLLTKTIGNETELQVMQL